MIKTRYYRFVFLLTLVLPLQAQVKKDSLVLSEVVVTGSQVEVAAKNIPSTISVIGRNVLESSYQTNVMPVLSERVPGLFVTERGIAGFGIATGAAGGITIRGIGSSGAKPGDPLVNTQVLFLIDGHPQLMGLMGHHLPDSYLSSNIERVEVIRGPASVLYGSNAMGGAINLITRKPQSQGLFLNADGEVGSFNTLHAGVDGMYRKGKWSGIVSVSRDQTDGDRPHSDYWNNSFFAKLSRELFRGIKVSTDLALSNYKATDPDTLGASFVTEKWAKVNRGVGSVSIENHFEKVSGALKLFYNFGEHHIYDGFHSTDHCVGLNFYQVLNLMKGNVITAGLDIKEYGGFAENPTLLLAVQQLMQFPVDKNATETGVYATMQQQITTIPLSIHAGLRMENSSVYGAEWIPQGGLIYRPLSSTTIKASVAKGFRSPTMKELYMFPPHNTALQPERMINYELSWLQQWNPNVSMEFTLFSAHGSNLIRQLGMKYENTGTFKNKGLEISFDYVLRPGWSFTSNYSYLNMETPVPAAPVHQFFGGFNFQPIKKMEVQLSVQHNAGLYLKTAPVVKEQYTLLNLKVNYKFNSRIEAYLSAANLLNQQYRINYGYPMPSSNGMLGIRIHLRSTSQK